MKMLRATAGRMCQNKSRDRVEVRSRMEHLLIHLGISLFLARAKLRLQKQVGGVTGSD